MLSVLHTHNNAIDMRSHAACGCVWVICSRVSFFLSSPSCCHHLPAHAQIVCAPTASVQCVPQRFDEHDTACACVRHMCDVTLVMMSARRMAGEQRARAFNWSAGRDMRVAMHGVLWVRLHYLFVICVMIRFESGYESQFCVCGRADDIINHATGTRTHTQTISLKNLLTQMALRRAIRRRLRTHRMLQPLRSTRSECILHGSKKALLLPLHIHTHTLLIIDVHYNWTHSRVAAGSRSRSRFVRMQRVCVGKRLTQSGFRCKRSQARAPSEQTLFQIA